MRTTILIPLHASARWREVVAGNIERLAPHAKILISDATGLDDSLDWLRARFGGLSHIEWLGPRKNAVGWVAHCNDLLGRVTTEFAMWLPHDDDADADWIVSAERALDAEKDAVLAIGKTSRIRMENGETPTGFLIELHKPFTSPDMSERVREAILISLKKDRRALWTAFHGVFRSKQAVPLPETGDGIKADILWAISMLAIGRFVPTEAIFRKRLHADNTSSLWPSLPIDRNWRAVALPQALAHLPDDMRVKLIAERWAFEVETLSRQLDVVLTRKREVEHSVSWQITRPLRWLARRFRHWFLFGGGAPGP